MKQYLFILLLVLAAGVYAEPWEILRDFKDGPQGWVFAGASQSGSPEAGTFDDIPGIAIPVKFPEPVQLFKERKTGGILGDYRRIAVDLFVPASAPAIEIVLFVKDKDGHWFSAEPALQGTVPGWGTWVFNVDKAMTPEGFSGWNEMIAADITAVGIQIYSRTEFSGTIGCSAVRGRKEMPDRQPLRFENMQLPRSAGKVYALWECEWTVNQSFKNPFDPEEIAIDAEIRQPDGKAITIPAFYYQDFIRNWDETAFREKVLSRGEPSWRLRYTPLQTGTHKILLKAKAGEETAQAGPFDIEVQSGDAPGFIVVDKNDPRFFAFTNGDWFYPVGHNVRSPNDPRCARVLGIDIPPDRGTYAYDDFIKAMAANQQNLFELWMCSWWVGIEWINDWNGFHGLGRYNMANAWRIDYLVEQARKNGLYIHLVIDNHGKLSLGADPEWNLSPYNKKNGGFLNHPNEFFSNERAKKLYRQKLRYILARWGWSPTIMGFELWSELDLVGKKIHRTAVVHAWHREMADLIHAYPVPRILTTHYSGDYKVIDPVMVRQKEIDYVVGDGYRGGGSFVDLAVRSAKSYVQYEKPGFMTEFGGAWNGTTQSKLKADLHAGIWSAFYTDAAGVPLLWWFDFIHRENLYSHFKAFSKYINGEDKRGRDMQPLSITLTGPEKTRFKTLSLADEKGAYIWVYDHPAMIDYPDKPKKTAGLGLTINDIQGKRQVEVWDTLTGEIVHTAEVIAKDNKVWFALPPFVIDCALKLRPGENPE